MKSRYRIEWSWPLLIAYSLLLAYWMLWGYGRTRLPEYSYNIIPLSTIRHYIPIHSMEALINIAGNIGVFLPFGVLIPLAIQAGFAKTIAYFLPGILLLELIQLITRRGSLDVDDVILNTTGVMIGYGLLRTIGYIWRRADR
ncbi:VanZ family protein [Paenibacillus lactis]|uniref:VanZ family protein n=1 Tax=Paenibacillus lactis 154 TaxID=743719 RepID=G4H9Y6_9BACL|nr:VanZ family protein [Paenibacillus lactis]EHB68671.1 VanZ family protein [Paenibacillus lactis 154]